MARTNLDSTSVYHTTAQGDIIKKAAALDNRSVSNFLVTLAMQRATELGVDITSPKPAEKKKRTRRTAGAKA